MNQIMYRFIVDYNALYKGADEGTTNVYWERQRNNKVPDRPSFPKLSIIELEVSMKDYKTERKVVKWPNCHGTVSTVWYLIREERWEPVRIFGSFKNKCYITVIVTFICLFPVEGTMVDEIYIYLCI
ncbi:hypothetical protein DPMN_187931 [Dreissena polymorpha]|uniref:Uncharacterized protein n=1 Tax=Dreissena polymorpha TaxID=45954 RepID=A0A9D4I801_DREPO|nr:hypothetical protein DPMN_187931 [Dreissena polymorpha]